jgi:2'-5' RNA ligase
VTTGPGSHPTETAVIVPVPSVEPVVGELRRLLDRAAAWGVPAHVTVLYPFLEPAQVDDALVGRITELTRAVPAFDCRFGRCGWFDEEVLWLAPDPDRPFRDLTAAFAGAFPGHPPYGGEYSDVVPHLTVGHRSSATLAALRAAEADVTRRLPLTARIDHATLIAGSDEPGSWHTVAVLPFGPPR